VSGHATGSLWWEWAETELGDLLVASSARGLALVCLDEASALERLEAFRAEHEPDARAVQDEDAVGDALDQLEEWAAGERDGFDLPLDLRGTEFQVRVWRELLAIPRGELRTYGEIARRIGAPGGARAVGGAAGSNPVPIVVPCHRVVAADGPGGFTGGLDWKRRLLEREGVELDG
jgi:methylated-DNA-[protein]-cysteine S-methyltransferase